MPCEVVRTWLDSRSRGQRPQAAGKGLVFFLATLPLSCSALWRKEVLRGSHKLLQICPPQCSMWQQECFREQSLRGWGEECTLYLRV